MKCIIFPMFNAYFCLERNKQIVLCKWVSWERRRSGSGVSFALADDCFKKLFQSSKGEKTDLANMCILLFRFCSEWICRAVFWQAWGSASYSSLAWKRRKQEVVFAQHFCETASLKCRLLPAAAAAIYTSGKTGLKCHETIAGKLCSLSASV